MPTAKKKKPASEAADLRARIAKALKIPEDQVEARALRELGESLGLVETKPSERAAPVQPPSHASPQSSYLPQRLYLMIEGRGLDGRGMPMEVIDMPYLVGSGRKCTMWINSPRIETEHLRITHGDEGWLMEDLGSQHGTFFGDKKIKRRVIQDGDEYRLAGYLRLRTELR